jgi:hypothetical protein
MNAAVRPPIAPKAPCQAQLHEQRSPILVDNSIVPAKAPVATKRECFSAEAVLSIYIIKYYFIL